MQSQAASWIGVCDKKLFLFWLCVPAKYYSESDGRLKDLHFNSYTRCLCSNCLLCFRSSIQLYRRGNRRRASWLLYSKSLLVKLSSEWNYQTITNKHYEWKSKSSQPFGIKTSLTGNWYLHFQRVIVTYCVGNAYILCGVPKQIIHVFKTLTSVAVAERS